MKTAITILFSAGLLTTGQAQLFTPESFRGAAVGGLIGGVVGHNHHRQTAEGIAIGAGVGYILGEVAHASRPRERTVYYHPVGYDDDFHPTANYDVTYSGYPRRHPSTWLYGPRRYYRPHRALTGAALGGITGAVIGNQIDGHSGEGAAIGAAAGLLLGSVAEHQARQREDEAAVASQSVYASPVPGRGADARASASPTPNPSTSNRIISQSAAPGPSAMGSANRLFGR